MTDKRKKNIFDNIQTCVSLQYIGTCKELKSAFSSKTAKAKNYKKQAKHIENAKEHQKA